MKNVALFCIATFLFCIGCASQNQRINPNQMEIDNLRREIRFLKQQNSQLLREMDNLKTQLSKVEQANKQVRADLAVQIDEIEQQINAVQGNLKDTNTRISSYRQRPRTQSNGNIAVAEQDTLKRMTSPQTLTVDQSRTLYNTSYRDLSRGNYQLALQGFRQFVADYPNSDLTDNAQYWIGEVYYAQGRFQNAIDEFEKVVKWYRTGDKTASAMLKIGFSYLSMNEIEQGKIYLEETIKEYPDSEEASRAKGRLASIK